MYFELPYMYVYLQVAQLALQSSTLKYYQVLEYLKMKYASTQFYFSDRLPVIY